MGNRYDPSDEISFRELTATPRRHVAMEKTRCKYCPVPVHRENGEYMHVDEGWRSQRLHGHYAEARYRRDSPSSVKK